MKNLSRAVILTILIFGMTSNAYSQLGSGSQEFDRRFGAGETASCEMPADLAFRYDLPRSRSLVAGFASGGCCYVSLVGTRLSPIEVLAFLSSFNQRVHGRDHRGDRLFLDESQMAFYPSVGRAIPRSFFEPVAIRPETIRSNGVSWNEYYIDNQMVGSEVTGAWDYEYDVLDVVGYEHEYLARGGVSRIVLTRGDRTAFVEFDLSSDSDLPYSYTGEVRLMSAEAYWVSKLNRLLEYGEAPPSPASTYLFPDVGYDEAVAMHVPGPFLLDWYRTIFLAALVDAVDNEHVSLTALNSFLSKPPAESVTRAMINRIQRQPEVEQRRRIDVLKSFGTDRALSALRRLARDDSLQLEAEQAIERIEAR